MKIELFDKLEINIDKKNNQILFKLNNKVKPKSIYDLNKYPYIDIFENGDTAYTINFGRLVELFIIEFDDSIEITINNKINGFDNIEIILMEK